MNIIEFAKDYKKLHCRTGDIFTTIRRDSDINARKFGESEGGGIFQVRVEGKDVFQAKLLFNSSPACSMKLMYLSEDLCSYDTDENAKELSERYENDMIILLIFQKMRDVERGNTL